MIKDPICGMTVNEHVALSLTVGGKHHYFCSQGCLEKFAAARGLSLTGRRLYRRPATRWERLRVNRLFQTAAVATALMVLSWCFPLLLPWRQHFIHYLRMIWWGVLFGLVLGGVIERYVPRLYISRLLAADDARTVPRAVLLGFLMSACSHGILALAVELYRKGAATPAVVAFLLASPWANMPLTFLMVSLFGWKAFLIIGGAVLVALTTGYIFVFLHRRGWVERNLRSLPAGEGPAIGEDIRKRWLAYRFSWLGLGRDLAGVWRGTAALSGMMLWWIIVGLLLASLSGAYLPTEVLRAHLGPTVSGLFFTLLLATVLEVCSEGTAPLAFQLYQQTGALGGSFVFLMAGVVTDYTEIGLLWTTIGRRTALLLPLVTVPQVMLLGWLVNHFVS